MDKTFMALVALLLILVLVAILVRGCLLDKPADPIEQTESTQQTVDTQAMGPPPEDPAETTQPTQPLLPELPEMELAAQTAFVYAVDRQQVLYMKGNAQETLYPASITKIFTAYVALQYLNPEVVLTAGEELELVASDASIAYIKKGHKLSVSMLIEGMLLPSGNDAAYVLAAGAGRLISDDGSLSGKEAVAYFVDVMNKSATELGLTGTHFCNPDGYHDENHYTTAQDLMQIARLAMESPVISQYAGLAQDDVVYASGQTNQWKNTNLLLQADSRYYCPDAVGMKTGRTDSAGCCLLAAFQTDNGLMIVGVFGCEEDSQRYEDALTIYENLP